MGTSLAEQLKKLTVPQTSALIQEKKRASLLFDPREAANLDRDTVYELGIDGLEELKKLNPKFGEFHNTLFNLLSKSLQRSVESQTSNKKLDNEIRKFLFLLSPYFLLKPAHKTLEWLITRFQIHQFNVDELLMLILPYHETRIFVRVLQLLNVKDPVNKWHWLCPLQKPGVPLSKTALLNHCASDTAFLHFVCKMTILAVKEYGSNATMLSTLLSFCCTTIVGALEYSKTVSEVQVTHILKLLLKGLTSYVLDYSAASIMITAQLARKTQLSKELLFNIVNLIPKNTHKVLEVECTMLLVLLYQKQHELAAAFPHKALMRLAKCPTFPAALSTVALSGGHIVPLLAPLLAEILKNVQTQPQTETENIHVLRHFAESLLTEMHLDDEGAETIISTVISSFDESSYQIQTDSASSDNELTQWYSAYLSRLERQYPTIFDRVVQRLLYGSSSSSHRKKALRVILGFLPRVSHSQAGTDIFEKLHHNNEKMRVEAVKYLSSTYSRLKFVLQEEDKQLLVNSLKDRLKDDSHEVVNAVLSFPVTVLASLIGAEQLLEELTALAAKFWYLRGKALLVTKRTLEYLCSNPSSDDTTVLLAVLPYLLPAEDKQVKLAMVVLESAFGSTNVFLKAVCKDIGDLKNIPTAQHLCSIVFNKMTQPKYLPSNDVLTETIRRNPQVKTEAVYKFLATILLTTAVSEQATPQKIWVVLDTVLVYANDTKVSVAYGATPLCDILPACMTTVRGKELPLQALIHCLSTVVSSVSVPEQVRGQFWWDLTSPNKTPLLLLTKIFEILIKGCSKESVLKTAYVVVLKKFFETHFPQLPDRIGFLCNLWVGHEIQGAVDYELQLRSLLLATALLRQTESSIGWTLQLQDTTIVPGLLVAVTCPLSPVRVAALDCLAVIGKSISGSLNQNSYIHLVEELLERREELKIDAEQLLVTSYTVLSPDPEVQCLIKQSRQAFMSSILEALVQCILNKHTPTYVSAALLRILTHVNSKVIFHKLVPLGKRMLIQSEKLERQMNHYMSAVFRNIVSRLDHNISGSLHKDSWDFFLSVLLNYQTLVFAEDGKITCPSILAMEQISKEVFESVPRNQQHDLLALLVTIGTDTDSPDVVSAVGAVGKRIILDCSVVVKELEKMRDAKYTEVPTARRVLRNRRSMNTAPSLELLKTAAWRRGITLVELIQNKKKLYSVHLLLPVLFDILKRCLDFEEQAPIEYTKQLLLSCILHCCQKLSPDGSPVSPDLIDPEKTLNVELVVQCIRASQNPQTHHHALLLLSQMAGMIPMQVLHNIMAIFTFMGSSILRQDDAYSFQVISKIVETVIPVVIKANEISPLSINLYNSVAAVIRVFVDALLDVPEHRRLPLFHKLLVTLDSQKFLWLLQCLVLENQVVKGSDPAQIRDSSTIPKRIEFLLNLAHMFDPHTVIHNCVNIMKYLRSLPMNKEDNCQQRATSRKSHNTEDYIITGVTALFDVERHLAKQLRHFKYTLTTYLSSLLSSPLFINQIASLNEEDTSQMKPLYTDLIENVLRYIQFVSREAEVNAGKPNAKYWKVMLNQGYDMLDKVNALLPSDMFVLVIHGLLDNKIPTVRRKAMELLSARLQNHEFFTSCNHKDLFTLLPPLIGIIRTISEIREETDLDQQLNQQTALLCVKMLARLLAAENPAHFKEILLLLTELLKKKTLQGNILASTVLCIAELFSTLRAFALGSLPKFMPILIKILHKEKCTESPDVVLLGVVSALCKVVESLPHFLSPYLEQLLVEVSILSARWNQDLENQKITPIIQKLKAIRQKVSAMIPPRVLIPTVGKCYAVLLKSEEYAALGPLLDILAGSFSILSRTEFKQLQSELTAFFLSALEFRALCTDGNVSQDEVFIAEGHVIHALVALVLKLSESSFRPLYYSLFHWATGTDLHKDRIITFYRCSSSIAECLKGLFVLFAGHFLKNAADMLDKNNVIKVDTLYFGSGEAAEVKSTLLLEFVLKTLHSVFLYDSQNFINKERFETLMLPMVNQLENTLGGVKALQLRASSLLAPCIAQFAMDVADDVLWKHLNYQLLLKTRHNLPQVRLVALETFCTTVHKLGEDFLPLLPETVPFLAELLEDEEEEVEKACQKTLQDLEEILGEPLKKYF